MNTLQDRLLGDFFLSEDDLERTAPNPARQQDGPWEKQRNPDTYELNDGCSRRLPCAGSDDIDYS